MAKRFYDSGKFQDPWYRKLDPKYKLFWDYLLCECNHAGIWKVDFELASFLIGTEIIEESALSIMSDRIHILNSGKWFIPKFISFQYGELNDSVNCHKSVIVELKKERVDQELLNSCPTVKDMVKDKVKDKDKKNKVYDFNIIWDKYPSKLGRKQAERHFKLSVKTEEDWKNIHIALINYINSERVKKGFIQNGSTWFNNWSDWIEQKQLSDFEKNIKKG